MSNKIPRAIAPEIERLERNHGNTTRHLPQLMADYNNPVTMELALMANTLTELLGYVKKLAQSFDDKRGVCGYMVDESYLAECCQLIEP